MKLQLRDKLLLLICVILSALGYTAFVDYRPAFLKMLADFGGITTTTIRVTMSSWFLPTVLVFVCVLEMAATRFLAKLKTRTAIHVFSIFLLLFALSIFFYSTCIPLSNTNDELNEITNSYWKK